jgi:ABC-type sugar transport system ATPase subunit
MVTIRCEKLTKRFGKVLAVDDVSLEIQARQVTCILGPSGCGKTTLMRMLAGLERPSAGRVWFADREVTHLPAGRRDVGMVFQDPVVYPNLSVFDNVLLPLKKLRGKEAEKRASAALKIVGLSSRAKEKVETLSATDHQKVAVAREVARNTKVLIFDEPLTNIRLDERAEFERSIRELVQETGQTLIYVTHDQTEAMTLSDCIVVMNDGRIAQCGAPREVYTNPDSKFVGWFLGNPGMNFIEVTPIARQDHIWIESPFLGVPLAVPDKVRHQALKIGFRPEFVRLCDGVQNRGFTARVVRKSLTTAGQILLLLERNGITFKAKIGQTDGLRLGQELRIEIPREKLLLFGDDGARISEVRLYD